jgi:hypothetical protein
MVLVFRDAIEEPDFRKVLGEVVDDILNGEPVIVDLEPEFSAAKGVAELAKRAIFNQKKEQGLDAASEL